MLSATESILLSVVISESIFGILGNGFIGAVNCIECVRSKKVSVINSIFIGLAISRICLIWTIITDGCIQLFSPRLYLTGSLVEYTTYSWVLSNHTCTWFTTSLTIFYFLRITNFSHPIFLWLKIKIHWIFSLLMGFLLISLLFSFPRFVTIISNQKMKDTNRTGLLTVKTDEYISMQVLLNLGTMIPFVITLIVCFLVIVSLWRHKKQMRLHFSGCRDLNTEAHVKAVKVLVSFIILFVLHFIGIVIEAACYAVAENKMLLIFGLQATITYPWGHSFILILANRKLKQTALRILRQLKVWEKRENCRTT
ncbi:taste receptor type 2 member 10 [Ochotona princeps]|uniref:taste receptor type 2 member 10 n=1 Tax=Ochotona princeps TaxID=9978 RepID=UPI002714DD59|nr:taste receptor type 2 member 10 [Ochotona princeps]